MPGLQKLYSFVSPPTFYVIDVTIYNFLGCVSIKTLLQLQHLYTFVFYHLFQSQGDFYNSITILSIIYLTVHFLFSEFYTFMSSHAVNQCPFFSAFLQNRLKNVNKFSLLYYKSMMNCVIYKQQKLISYRCKRW